MRSDPLAARVRALLVQGSADQARQLLEEALQDDPRRLDALLLMGELLLDLREAAPALELFQRAVGVWPRSAAAQNALARCLLALDRVEEALAVAELAKPLLDDADNFVEAAPVYLTLVWCLRELRRFKEALELAEEGLARTPDAVLAECASEVEHELALAQRERC